MIIRLRSLLAVLFLMLPLIGVQAENLATVLSTAAAPLPQKDAKLLTVDGRVLAVSPQAGGAALLSEDRKSWTDAQWRPDMSIATSATREHDTVIVGGTPGTGAAQTVELVRMNGSHPATTPLPALPDALRSARAAILADKLYVTGLGQGDDVQIYVLALADSAKARWEPFPHPARLAPAITSMAAQNSALLITLKDPNGGGDHLLRWRAKDGWTDLPQLAGTVADGAVKATGQAHVLYLLKTASATPQLWTYHTITGSWAKQAASVQGDVASGTGVTNGLVWADSSGATGSLQIQSGKRLLKAFDWFVIVAYLVGMLGIGWYFYAREKRNNTADFFVGGRKIPFWAAGISLYAANTSSISYIAIPAKAFETNWQYMTNNLIAAVALVFVAIAIVPLLRRLNLMSVFQYLEIRFHPSIRMLASLICILVQIGSRMSVILLLPSLAIATITGIDVTWSILMMGGFTIVYTAMGGMKAVVWTDFVQLIVKMGGVLFAIGFIVYGLNGGVSEFVSVAAAEHKTKLFDFSWDLTQPTVWGFIFLVIFDVILTFPKDQVLMQRALSTKSAAESTRSILTFSAISIPAGFLFYAVGTALYAFYKSHPERMDPTLNVDATFPLFIAGELPTGVTGLIIAGILAAAMATLSGIMNSVATLASVDFYEKLAPNRTPKQSVVFAEAATVATGLIGIGAAIWLSRINAHSLFDVSIELAGLLGGGFAGAYTLGMFTRRANWQGVVCGIIGSTGLTTVAWAMKLVHPYFYLPISIMLCICIGYVASYLFPAPKQSLAGLTIYKD
ncbi:sodium:solute symporter [Massilia arenosa]|uniref:Sodium:solute symporter n=1 Tax=Zemynaea arenosa TaxID=2561931 RepID=A0A4Y9S5V6_9BURK|nr:sodium:solute symporter [Massilia arenosa]TFW16573.1 sodium:solute symporter [Massilia arenosa]